MEREGGERGRRASTGGRERERGKRARRGAGFSRNSAFQALGIQVRQGGGAGRHQGEGAAAPPAGLFSCGMLKDCTQRE